MRPLLRLAGLYLTVFIVISAAFFLLLRTPLFASQDVLFYRGVELLLVIAVLFGAGAALYAYVAGTERLESILAAGISSLAIHLALFVVFPVTFDRSVTMYLLSTLEAAPATQTCSGYGAEALEEKFVQGYVEEQGAIARRLKEQSIIGLLSPNPQCVSLTPRGENFLDFARTVGTLYNLKP